MELSREVAFRIWNKQYGKAIKVFDFAGRRMDKASYGDHNSLYGWNLDHIFPVSKGGKTNDSNLICVNILTNEEKADKTTFIANGKKFNIQKRQNHYEIFEKKENATKNHNIYDSAECIEEIYEIFENEKFKYISDVVFVVQTKAPYKVLTFLNRSLSDLPIVGMKQIDGNIFLFNAIGFGDTLNRARTNAIDNACLTKAIFDYELKKHNYIENYSIYIVMNIAKNYPLFADEPERRLKTSIELNNNVQIAEYDESNVYADPLMKCIQQNTDGGIVNNERLKYDDLSIKYGEFIINLSKGINDRF